MGGEPLRDILSRPAPDAVTGFVERWHSRAPEPRQVPGAERLPAALRRFHESFGTAADAFAINHLLPPSEIEEDGGFAVFYVEEQAVYLWGIAVDDLESPDPPVWSRENEPGRGWVQEAPSMSVFLVQMLVMSAALSGPHAATAAWLEPSAADSALAPLKLLDLPPWQWPSLPARWYAGDDAVAFTCPNRAEADAGDSLLSVWVAGLSEESIRFIEPHLTDAWEYYSPRDG
jgi:hypothetical protein